MRLRMVCVLSLAGLGAVRAQTPVRESTVRDTVVKVPPRTLSTPIRVCAGGDVTLGTNLDPRWAKSAAKRLDSLFSLSADPDSLAPQLAPFVSGANVLLFNFEGAIGAGPVERKCGPKSTSCFAFRQP